MKTKFSVRFYFATRLFMSCPTHHPELGNSFESDGHLVNLSSRWLFFDRFLLKKSV